MKSELGKVTESLRGFMDDVKREVAQAAQDVEAGKGETIQAIQATRGFIKEVRDDVAELRALLGTTTNSPPLDDAPVKKKGLF